jgi:hypothetical protein
MSTVCRRTRSGGSPVPWQNRAWVLSEKRDGCPCRPPPSSPHSFRKLLTSARPNSNRMLSWPRAEPTVRRDRFSQRCDRVRGPARAFSLQLSCQQSTTVSPSVAPSCRVTSDDTAPRTGGCQCPSWESSRHRARPQTQLQRRLSPSDGGISGNDHDRPSVDDASVPRATHRSDRMTPRRSSRALHRVPSRSTPSTVVASARLLYVSQYDAVLRSPPAQVHLLPCRVPT